MSTILQPCQESQFFETSTILKLNVAKPLGSEFSRNPCMQTTVETLENNHGSNEAEAKNTSMHNDSGGWSFLQVISNASSCPEEKENVYIHPLARRSAFSGITEKGFQLCTENLGSENGADILEDMWDFITGHLTVGSKDSPMQQSHVWNSSSTTNSSILTQSANTRGNSTRTMRQVQEGDSKKKMKSCGKFPPPLTTMRGENSIRVTPHREGGRLVMKAVEAPQKRGYLHAERSHGRLRLCYMNDGTANFDRQVCPDDNESDCEDEKDCNDEGELEKNEEFHNQEDGQENCNQLTEDVEGNNYEVGVEVGNDKFQRIGRCNEGEHGNKGLCNWEPFWVATS